MVNEPLTKDKPLDAEGLIFCDDCWSWMTKDDLKVCKHTNFNEWYRKHEVASAVRLLREKIKKLKIEHQKLKDGDGFYDCAIIDQKSMRVAPKGEWLGTEKRRQEALREQARMDKLIGCDTCDLLKELDITTLKVFGGVEK